jgi:hypothetical protein
MKYTIHQLEKYKDEVKKLYLEEKLSAKAIGIKLGWTVGRVNHVLTTWKIPRRNISDSHGFEFDKHYFDNIDTEEKAYFLGFIAADGNVHKNSLQLCLHPQDIEILEKFKSVLKAKKDIKDDKRKNGRVYKRFGIGNVYFANVLRSKGIVDRKTFVLKFPSEEILPKELVRHYIRGYFDGDGCITFHSVKVYGYIKWKFEIVSNTHMVNSMLEIFNEKIGGGIFSIRREKRRQNPIYYLTTQRIKKDYLVKIYKFLYEGSTISLTRKREKIEFLLKDEI